MLGPGDIQKSGPVLSLSKDLVRNGEGNRQFRYKRHVLLDTLQEQSVNYLFCSKERREGVRFGSCCAEKSSWRSRDARRRRHKDQELLGMGGRREQTVVRNDPMDHRNGSVEFKQVSSGGYSKPWTG